MPKTAASRTGRKARSAKMPCSPEPWSCRHHAGRSEIEAWVEAGNGWQTVAEVRPSPHFDAGETAAFIVRAVNDYARSQNLIAELIDVLETCLACKDLDWAAEHDGEIVLRRAKAHSR